MLWTGRVLSALPVLMLSASGAMKLSANPQFVAQFQEHLGYPGGALLPIALAELVSTLLYAVPRTSVFGAVLLTAYLGGATATHVRVGEPFLAPVLIGVMLWLGLFLRDARLRALLPLRQPA
ncbi:MAG: DoxX family protein [Polyangiaceae bacterium]|nr:DoxX family protein [Myxococcales bacterium]MCB9587839.1 DoxX family protein [Polyangiaceae bacterium]MCB9608788.1 DoxX family protein [Polyangiaceae bacterium]